MPDMPQQGGAAPSQPAPGGAPAPGGDAPQGQGGGIAEAIAMVDSTVNKIAQAVSQNPKVGDDVKQAWQEALAALRKAEEALVSSVGGEADGKPEPDEDDGGGAASMEAGGAKGAVPMTHQNLRGQ